MMWKNQLNLGVADSTQSSMAHTRNLTARVVTLGEEHYDGGFTVVSVTPSHEIPLLEVVV